MFKNVASQKITLLAIDTASNVPKTGDSANITAYVSKDDGAVTVLGDMTATELDATNAPGLYSFDLTQAETNADKLVFSAKSSTSGVKIVPVLIYTYPPYFSTLGINSSGHISRVVLCDTITTYTGNTPQTGDAYAIVSSGTHGNAALKTLVDDLPTNAELTTALAGADDAVLAAIAALSIPTVAAIADAVWDETMSGHTTDGTYGGRIVRATNSNVSVQITGSNHVAADVHEFQAGVITAGDFADNAITSSVLAASAVSEIVVGVLTTAMTEAYRSTGAAPTVAQALFEILQNLTEFSISGTTKTAKKLDGSTTAKTYTLDSATAPTSITETT